MFLFDQSYRLKNFWYYILGSFILILFSFIGQLPMIPFLPTELPSPDALVTSFGILTKPIFGGLILPAFLNESWLWIIILLVIYFVAWAWLRKNKQQVHDYLERTADGDAPVEA